MYSCNTKGSKSGNLPGKVSTDHLNLDEQLFCSIALFPVWVLRASFVDFQQSSSASLPSFIRNCPESHHTLDRLRTPPLSTLQLPSALRSSLLPSPSSSRSRHDSGGRAREERCDSRGGNAIFRLCVRGQNPSSM